LQTCHFCHYLKNGYLTTAAIQSENDYAEQAKGSHPPHHVGAHHVAIIRSLLDPKPALIKRLISQAKPKIELSGD
jgi:hypothetical protein